MLGMGKPPNEATPSRRKFLAGMAGVGATIVSGEAMAKASQSDIDIPKVKMPPNTLETSSSPEKIWEEITGRLVEGLSHLVHDKEQCADNNRFSAEANTIFTTFFAEAADFKGTNGAQSTALDMYALHYVLVKARSVKMEPAVMSLIEQAWNQTSETAIKESLESPERRRIFTFVPDDTA